MSGFVYLIVPEAVFLRDSDHHLVKIGHTKGHPNARMHALSAGSHLTLELAAFFPGGQDLERAFHEAFAPLRSHREWFFMEGKLFDFVTRLYNPPTFEQATRDAVATAVSETIFARCSSHPAMSDDFYRGTAIPHHLAPFFPEVFA